MICDNLPTTVNGSQSVTDVPGLVGYSGAWYVSILGQEVKYDADVISSDL